MTKPLSRFQVAKLVNVAPGTIDKWIGNGRLKAAYVPGPGGVPRLIIARDDLVEFLKAHGLDHALAKLDTEGGSR